MLAEILPLGVLTRIYDNIRSNQIRKKIAQEFSLGVPVFNSWMTIITVARNNCGHQLLPETTAVITLAYGTVHLL